MIDKNNNFKILEINPRPSGSFIVAEAAGYPLIENLLKIYLNKKKYTKVKKVFNKILPYKSFTCFDKK
jgi:predicted ATP-grasp superfamily ATP-dependent carboligase